MDDRQDDAGYDESVGRNVQALRKARGMTQAQLADRLALKGMPFRQQTIVKVEKGERPLRLKEAHTIAKVLEVDVDALTADEARTSDVTLAVRQATSARYLAQAIYAYSVDLIEIQEHLRQLLARNKRVLPLEIENAASTAIAYSPADVAQTAMADATEGDADTEKWWLPWQATE